MRVALRAAARGGRRRGALEGGAARAASAISPGRATLDRAATRRRRSTRPQPEPPLEARPNAAQRHRDRALAARSLHDLRQAYPAAAPARCGRHAARRARPRHRDPRRDRRLHRELTPTGCPPIRSRELIALGEKHFAPLEDYPEAQRVLVAALPAHRALVRRMGGKRRASVVATGRRSARRARNSDRRAHLHATRARRPHRAAAPTALRDPRLQDRRSRRPSRRCAPGCRRSSRSKARSCARAASRTCRQAHRSPSSFTCRCAAREPAGEAKPIEFKDGDARPACRPGARAADKLVATLRRRGRRPIARWSARCGRRATATTTIWRASRNGRAGGEDDGGARE